MRHEAEEASTKQAKQCASEFVVIGFICPSDDANRRTVPDALQVVPGGGAGTRAAHDEDGGTRYLVNGQHLTHYIYGQGVSVPAVAGLDYNVEAPVAFDHEVRSPAPRTHGGSISQHPARRQELRDLMPDRLFVDSLANYLHGRVGSGRRGDSFQGAQRLRGPFRRRLKRLSYDLIATTPGKAQVRLTKAETVHRRSAEHHQKEDRSSENQGNATRLILRDEDSRAASAQEEGAYCSGTCSGTS